MPIPQIDYQNQAIQEIPEFHRTPRYIAWMQGCMSQVSWLAKNFLGYCFGDTLSPVWSSSITYSINDTVTLYSGVYVSTISNNLGNIPDSPTNWIYGSSYLYGNVVLYLNNYYQVQNVSGTSSTPGSSSDWILCNYDLSTNSTYYGWYKVAPSNIGAFERGQYNAQKLNMEYGLNKYFRTVFRNPTSITLSASYTPRSDIYIDTLAFAASSFLVYPSEPSSASHVYPLYSDGTYIYVTPVLTSATSYIFQVNVPISLTSSLGFGYESIIRNKIDKVNLAGLAYKIVLY